jgi:hypothetical protein
MYRNDATVGFAHCISADFNSKKQMSKGVAVSFKNLFGKPKPSDYYDKYITCQQNKDEAAVYSLVTKPKYFMKPNPDIYNTAFLQLTNHFKSMKLHTLICSPLGCIRDRITVHHFAAEIVKFQINTGAYVKIVTYDESSKSKLRNGLTHAEFLHQLENTITFEVQNSLNTLKSNHTTQAGPQLTVSSPPLTDDSNISEPSSCPDLSGSLSSLFLSSPVLCQEGGKNVNMGICEVTSEKVITEETNGKNKKTKDFLAISQTIVNIT